MANGNGIAFDDAPEMTMRDYWHVVVQRKWLVLMCIAVTVGAAMGMVALQDPIYEAEAQMLVRSLPGDSVFGSTVNNPSNAARLIETEIRILEGAPVEDRVRENLAIEGDIPNVSAAAVGQTDVVAVRVRSHDAETAAELANAYVQAYIDVRREQNVNSLLDAAGEIQKKVTDLQLQIDELDAQVAAAPDPDAKEKELAAQRQLLVDQQAVFKQQVDQIQVDASLQSGSAQMVRPATVPEKPVEPTPLRTALLAAIVGLLLGLGVAFLADYLDDSINDPDDLERISGGLPVLTVVPEDTPPDQRPVAISKPNDVAVEAYRSLRTALQFVSMEKPLKVVQVTSPLPGEGKTTTAANLAVLMAQAGRRVVLVDADLRRPRLHQMFGCDSTKGLTAALLGTPLIDLLWPVAVDGGHLEVLAAGFIPSNPSETLGGQRMRAVMADLTRQFDMVVIDSAPVLPVTDAVVLAGLADAVVLVARAHQTTDRQVRESMGLLSRGNAPLVGAVLNRVDASKDRYGSTYGYRAGYGDYADDGDKGKSKKK